MGLIEKGITKHRTKDQIGPVAIEGNWESHGSLTAAAIVRAAACTLGQMNLTSSTFRGHDVLGIHSSRNSGASNIWVEQVGFRKWTISLGVGRHTYTRALDWQLTFSISDEPGGGRTVTVSTGTVATKDGSQVHKHEFLEARNLVLTGLQLGKVPSRGPEETITARSRTRVPAPVVGLKDGGGNLSHTILTILAVSDITQSLDRLPCQVVQAGELSWQLKIGARGQAEAQYIDVAAQDLGNQRKVDIRCSVDLGPKVAINIINVKDASFLSALFIGFLREADAELTLDNTSAPEVTA